jgi:hypothetical protein
MGQAAKTPERHDFADFQSAQAKLPVIRQLKQQQFLQLLGLAIHKRTCQKTKFVPSITSRAAQHNR